MRIFLSRQFFLFLATGGLAAVVNFGSRFAYNRWTSYSTAIILAYLTGMLTAFLLAKAFVFPASRHSTARSALFFVLVNAIAVLQTWAISMGLACYVFPFANFTWHPEAVAHLIGILVPVFTSYVGHKYFSFRQA